MKIIKQDKEKLVFELIASAELANSLRRAAIYKVPTLAIEDIYFTENNSILYDEQIAIRLGLLVLKANIDKLSLPSGCSCKGKGCKKCQVSVELKEKGPKMVYAKDLKIVNAAVVHPETPIVWLEDSHEIDLKANAVLGTGEEHAKWNTGWAYYKQEGNKLIFTLESWGQLEPKIILKKAAEIVKSEIKEVKL